MEKESHKKPGKIIRLTGTVLIISAVSILLWSKSSIRQSSVDAAAQERTVYVQGQKGEFELIRNGQPFVVRGGAGMGFYKELREAGGNTIRVYDTLQLGAVLDSALRYDLAVIADLPMPGSKHLRNFYEDRQLSSALHQGLLNTVKQHKDHPALLMWNLGNEVVFPIHPRYKSFYSFYNGLLKEIKEIDPNHPVCSSLESYERRVLIKMRLRVPGLDLVGFNTFGHLATLESSLDRFAWFWTGPYLITETGPNGYWEESTTAWKAPIEVSSRVKAEQVRLRYSSQMPLGDPRFLGACFFYWGNHREATSTWFSIFDRNGRKTAMYSAIAEFWGSAESLDIPVLNTLSIEGKTAKDHILLEPEGRHTALLNWENLDDTCDVADVQWNIRPEDWYSHKLDHVEKPKSLNQYIVHSNRNSMAFRVPTSVGPYRIYASIVLDNGSVETANIPFYTIQ